MGSTKPYPYSYPSTAPAFSLIESFLDDAVERCYERDLITPEEKEDLEAEIHEWVVALERRQ